MTNKDIMEIRKFFMYETDYLYFYQDILPVKSKATIEEFVNYLLKWLNEKVESGSYTSKIVTKLNLYLTKVVEEVQYKKYNLPYESWQKMEKVMRMQKEFFEEKQMVDSPLYKSICFNYDFAAKAPKEEKDEIVEEEKVKKKALDDEALEIKKITEEKEKLERRLKKNDAKIETILKEKEKLELGIKELEQVQKMEQEYIQEQLQLIQSLEEKILAFQLRDNEIERQKKINLDLSMENQSLKQKWKQEQKLKEMEKKDQGTEEEMKHHLLELLQSPRTFTELLDYFERKSFLVSKEQLQRLITNFGQEFQLKQSFSIPRSYALKKAFNSELPQFHIPFSDSKSFLLVSDYHVSTCDDDLIRLQDSLYEFATKNKIHTILMLGDLFGYKTKKYSGPTIDELDFMRGIVEDFGKKMPYDKNIQFLMLGGNHDKIFRKYGYDPLTILSRMRDDYYHLGYDHAIISLEKDERKTNFFLHHFHSRGLTQNEFGHIDSRKLEYLLMNWYQKYAFNREDTYLDLFGHYHISYFDLQNEICSVPSLTYDRVSNGFYTMTCYGNDGNLSHTIFTPYSYQGEAKKTGTEIVYRKKML